MRIAIVNHRYAPFRGGSERYAQEVAEEYARGGADVTVVTSDAFDLEYFWDPRRARVAAPTRERLNGVTVVRVPVRHYPLSSYGFRGGHRLLGDASAVVRACWPYRQAARLLPWLPTLDQTLAELGPLDVVWGTNLGLEGMAWSALRAARRQGARFVLAPFAHLGSARDRRLRRYVTMPHQLELIRAADGLIAMTHVEASFLRAAGARGDRIVVAGAGTLLEEVTGGDAAAFRERYGLRAPLVGALGALAPDKGTLDLVRAIAALRRDGRAVELALAGPTLSSFERWFATLDKRDRDGVHVLGIVDDATRRDMLSAVDVLALPSRSESFGIVFVEAWANRKPVVGARAGAIPELVRDGDNGLLAPFGDHAALARALATLLDDNELRLRLGTAGYALTVAEYTWPRVFARIDGVVERALGWREAGACTG